MVTSVKAKATRAKAKDAPADAPAAQAEVSTTEVPEVEASAPPLEVAAETIETTIAVEEVAENPVTEQAVTAEAAAVETAEEVMTVKQEGMVMVDMMEATQKLAEDTKAKFEAAFADLSEKAKASVEKSSKAMEEISDMAKGNVEALVESSKIAAKGMESIGQNAADFSRTSFEKTTAVLKGFAAVKSPAEFFQLQNDLISSTLDAFAKETAKNSEVLFKLAGEVAQPISSRVALVTDKVKSFAA